MIEATPTIEGETISRVALSDEAATLLRTLWDMHGPLMFHQSGGCCDGSAPMCFAEGDYMTGPGDVRLGEFDISEAQDGSQPISFWMSTEQFQYWSHTHLTVDAVPGRGAGFSLEGPEGKRFIIHSRLMETAEPFVA
ncbi:MULTISPECIES: DUF779 domain-containing protein [Pontimonas]|jgi:uncharacterized protein (DUF779 family)|uniref:DUF779-like protein n=1 Tax=Pontimonas salivibrio TaxID=1159327 RepID=A0A2L2BPE6_9MICO|nr:MULTISPECIES: DUF779 domain-containing protein [Pontimonas]AVG23543.1 DUF779-like protein [Pontimonas salivibrio]MDR9396208.1 DUF779 domain-containing protein [Pontimonas sp.]